MRAWCFYVLVLALWLADPARTQAQENRLAIIIDDIGYNRVQGERAARLAGNFTLSVLPFTPHAIEIAHLAHAQGKELMLHLPMSNLKDMPLGKGALKNGMARDDVMATVRADLGSLPYIKGVNNHMGSRLTQDVETMGWLMEALQGRGLYFVDSRTSAQTVALSVAQSNRIPSAKRDVFLDDSEEPQAIAFQLQRAIGIAKQKGQAIAIGHPYTATLNLLDRIQPILEQAQVRLVYASQLTGFATARPAKARPFIDHCPVLPAFMWPESHQNVDAYDIPAIIGVRLSGY